MNCLTRPLRSAGSFPLQWGKYIITSEITNFSPKCNRKEDVSTIVSFFLIYLPPLFAVQRDLGVKGGTANIGGQN